MERWTPEVKCSERETRLRMHTMYIDKPIQGHGLVQVLARVNRVFRDKPGGLVNGEVKTRSKHNLVQVRSFAELLKKVVRRYQNRAIEASQVIEELIELAKDIREAQKRGAKLGLSSDELAFYDALEVNDSAVHVLGDDTLRMIALERVETVRRSVTIGWTVKESVRAKLRVIVKRILRKYGYPPDKQEVAMNTVLQQVELLSNFWTEHGRAST